MKPSLCRLAPRLLVCATLGLALAASLVPAQTPVDEDSPWPRVRSTNGHTVTLHLPQVERWTSNWFSARAAVEVKPAGAKQDSLGVIWFEARGVVDRSKRVVSLDRIEITKARFPETSDGGSNALALVREVVPGGARTVSLDYLITALGFAQLAARQGAGGLKHTPPEIIRATNRTVLVRIDGEPVLRPIPGSTLERVINTPALLVRDPAGARFYLAGEGLWFSAGALRGPWSLAQTPPPEVVSLSPPPSNASPSGGEGPPPAVVVSTSPAELLLTSGLPDFRPIPGTDLQYVADTDSQLFYHSKDREAYLLLSGRWFKAKSLNGPWTYVAPHDLPADFAKIPPNSPQAIVLASVPETRQAELALLANSIPTTATVKRREATPQLAYDGEPQFKPIEGTSMSYAINAQLPVVRSGDSYYGLDNGVWFLARSATGPWEVATEVPEEIYTIPPSSPVYYATFVRVYGATDDEVEVGYTPGYQGTYEDDGTVVYGTGWDYQPWTGSEYYGWGWTWGYSYVYVPWYQWWLWRHWWDPPGGLRAALIENVYDRWQGRSGVTHYDVRPDSLGHKAGVLGGPSYSGYPALYGRFQGATRPAAMTPPASTLALNPYARPSTFVPAGEIPRGAQRLSDVRQAPGGGRDLYASPDGSIYQRKSDGWYRRQQSGSWALAAPLQGQIERSPAAAGRGAAAAGAGAVYRPTPGDGAVAARALARSGRVPDSGFTPQAREVAALEQQYYARSLGNLRAQNWRASASYNRPVRVGGRRR